MPDKHELQVELPNGYLLCASIAKDETNHNGIIVYLKDAQGTITQDIAGIHVQDTNLIRHLLYEDCNDENYTKESIIPVYQEES